MARGLKFRTKIEEGLYFPCSENKGADQLRGYREADLRLCFRICKKPVFSQRGSFNLAMIVHSRFLSIIAMILISIALDGKNNNIRLDFGQIHTCTFNSWNIHVIWNTVYKANKCNKLL